MSYRVLIKERFNGSKTNEVYGPKRYKGKGKRMISLMPLYPPEVQGLYWIPADNSVWSP